MKRVLTGLVVRVSVVASEGLLLTDLRAVVGKMQLCVLWGEE